MWMRMGYFFLVESKIPTSLMFGLILCEIIMDIMGYKILIMRIFWA